MTNKQEAHKLKKYREMGKFLGQVAFCDCNHETLVLYQSIWTQMLGLNMEHGYTVSQSLVILEYL